jgi:quercetin dioxygenase-like cupin family protein
MNTIRLSFAAIALVLAQGTSPVGAQTFPPLTRDPVLSEALPKGAPIPTLLKGARIKFAPGQPTGRHLHPVSVVGVVTQGSFIVQVEGGQPRTIKAGEPFFEAANVPTLRFDNASQTEPAEIVAFYLTDSDSRPLIKMLDAEKP